MSSVGPFGYFIYVTVCISFYIADKISVLIGKSPFERFAGHFFNSALSRIQLNYECIITQCIMMLLRGGPTFDPVKYVNEVSHVEHMHADRMKSRFSGSR